MGLNPTTAARPRSQLSSTARNTERSCDLQGWGSQRGRERHHSRTARSKPDVHAGGKIDERFRNRVSTAYPRRLKTKLRRRGRFNSSQTYLKPIIEFLYLTGMRSGAAKKLEHKHVDL